MKSPAGDILVLAQGMAGDRLGARITPALREAFPHRALVGIGGERMERAGVRLAARTDSLSAMGYAGLLKLAPRILASMVRLSLATRHRPPACVIAVDVWQPLKVLHRFAPHLGAVPHVCYLPPAPNLIGSAPVHQAVVAQFAATLTPFNHQVTLFRGAGGVAEPAAHAGLELLREEAEGAAVSERDPILAILPGSRPLEVRCGLPQQWDAAQRLLREHSRLQPIICAATPELRRWISRQCPGVEISENARRTLARARLAILCSGTASLEATVLGCPGVVTYHLTRFQRWEWDRAHAPKLAKLRADGIASPWIALPNILAGEELYPEVLDRPGEEIAEAALAVMEQDPVQLRAKLDAVALSLAWNSAGKAVADQVGRILG